MLDINGILITQNFFDKKTYKNSKNLDKNMLCLPTNNNFKLNDIRKICHIINNI